MEQTDSSPVSSPILTPTLAPLKSMESDDDYQSSQDESEVKLPTQNAVSQALYNKYQKQDPSVIREVPQEYAPPSNISLETFRIKNLDTGQEQEIKNEEQELSLSSKLSVDRNDITTSSENSWRDFWTNVYRNNERLKQYCQEGLYDEARKILQEGQNGYPVETDWQALDNWTPLHFASYEGHEDIVELLCKHGANVNSLTKYNRNALHIAALRGHIQVAKALVQCGIEINAYDTDGNTALHFASENGHREIIVMLLEKGSKITKNREGSTPIQDCYHQYLKKAFYEQGYREDGEYPQNGVDTNPNLNKLHRQLVDSGGLTADSFEYLRVLGRGSFGEVFLVRRKGQESRLLAMKILKKERLAVNNLKRYAMTERNVMSTLNHPFMVRLAYAFQSPSRLFLVMDYYPGGDLGRAIARKKSFSQEDARKYVCELLLAIEALHKNMIIFRDLKPDNVVLDAEGHCRLADFGLSKEGIYNNITQSFCGSVAYLAPQILSKQGHSRTVDWYLLGVLLYELIVGLPPYYNTKKEVLFENIRRGPLKIPKALSFEGKDLIKRLLCRDPKRRLGAINDAQQIKEHPFFASVNWEEVFARKVPMPPIEESSHSNFSEPLNVTFEEAPDEPQGKVEGWTFIQSY